MGFDKNNRIKMIGLIAGLAILVPSAVSAASISLEPEQGSIERGQETTVSVYIQPEEGETVHTAEVNIGFSSGILSLLRADKEENNVFKPFSEWMELNENFGEGEVTAIIGYPTGISERTKAGEIAFVGNTIGTASVFINEESSEVYTYDENSRTAIGILEDTTGAEINITQITTEQTGQGATQTGGEEETTETPTDSEGEEQEQGTETEESEEEEESEETTATQQGGMMAAVGQAWNTLKDSNILLGLFVLIILAGAYVSFRRYRKKQSK